MKKGKNEKKMTKERKEEKVKGKESSRRGKELSEKVESIKVRKKKQKRLIRKQNHKKEEKRKKPYRSSVPGRYGCRVQIVWKALSLVRITSLRSLAARRFKKDSIPIRKQ